MRISKNFTLKELTKSNTALRLGIDNTPSKEGVLKLALLATTILQPLRDVLGALRITSGYRSPELNRAIGGSANSSHTMCQAADIQYYNRGKMNNLSIFIALVELGLEFDQCILEFGDSTEHKDPSNPDWIHLSWNPEENRQEILVAYKDKNNRTAYRYPINYNRL